MIEIPIPLELKVSQIELAPEHLATHVGLTFQLPQEVEISNNPLVLADVLSRRRAIFLLVDELLQSGFPGGIELIDPFLSMKNHQQTEQIQVALLFDEYFKRACPRLNEATTQQQAYYWRCDGLGKVTTFIRDDFLVGKHDGQPLVVASAPAAIMFNRTIPSYQSRLAILVNLFRARAGFFPYYFEGGNVAVSRRHIFIGRETFDAASRIHYNQTQKIEEPVLAQFKAKLEQAFQIGSGKELVIIDEQTGVDREQEVYHLDLSFKFCRRPDGSEAVFLSSMRLAKELLAQAGLINGSFQTNIKQWYNANLYPDMAEAAGKQRQKQLLRLAQQSNNPTAVFLKRLDNRNYAELAQSWAESSAALINDPFACLKLTGEKLPLFFREENYAPVQQYLDLVGSRLAALGYQVIEIPALLIEATNFERLQSNYSPQLGKRNSPVPIYAPVNAIQYNPEEGNPWVIGSGYLRFLDDEVKKRYAAQGLNYLSLMRGATFGRSVAGFNCLGLPINISREMPRAIAPGAKSGLC